MANNVPVISIAGILKARALAVDPYSLQVWSYRQQTLEAFDFMGNLRFSLELPIADDALDEIDNDTGIIAAPK